MVIVSKYVRSRFWHLSNGYVSSWLNLGLVALVLVLVGGRWFWVMSQRPAHRQEITSAFGSISLFYGDPQMNHAGSQLAYMATADHGYAVFVCDTVSGRKRVAYLEKGSGPWGDSFDIKVGPWSPDGSSFIYTTKDKLVICPADTNLPPTELNIGTGKISSMVWLNPSLFVWLDKDNLGYARRFAVGNWKIYRLPQKVQIQKLTAIDDHTIAWLQGDAIWRLDLTESQSNDLKPTAWITPKLTGTKAFSYSQKTGRILLSCTKNGWDSVWLVELTAGASAKATQLLQDRSLRDVQWAGDQELAYASSNTNHPGLVVTNLASHAHHRLFEQEKFGWFQVIPEQRQIFVFGNFSNEPAKGVWQYDLNSGQFKPVVPGSDHPSVFAKIPSSSQTSIKLPTGRSVDCTLYPPTRFDQRKKYPVIIGNTTFGVNVDRQHILPWVQAMATAGAYVVIINRKDWYKELDIWAENVIGLNQSLKSEPWFDAKRVYLFGASRETQSMSECLEKTPTLWAGALFFNPSGLPDFSQLSLFQPRPKLLIIAGSEEHQESNYKKYQLESIGAGILADVIIQPGEGHRFAGNAAQLERIKTSMDFIFEE